MTLDEALQVVEQLSLVDKVRLLETIAPQIRRELLIQKSSPKKSLRGIWRGVDITESEITELRQEMWQTFPREEV